MENLNKILLPLLIIIGGLTLYLVFDSGSKLKEAKQMIESAQQDIEAASDSISKSRASLNQLLQFSKAAEVELGILQNERRVIELESERKRAANWEELQRLKKEISERESALDSLKTRAKEFEV